MVKPHLNTTVGIDDMAIYIPKLYLSIEDLAEARQLEYAKLSKGLGLLKMAITDVHEDAATMAANAVLQLIEQNGIDPRTIGRIYMGTESATDGSKPMASYVLEMLTQYFAPAYGNDCLLNCDVVDLTFACIGAVDAMQNTLDWIRAGQDRIGIVVGSDVAKYELGSGGEYTQGAGAVALLLKRQPRLLALSEQVGVATRGVHDFFKPVRSVSKKALVTEVLQLAGLDHIDPEQILNRLNGALEVHGVLDQNEDQLYLHKETPVFDGPYSNDCYQERIREALQHFARIQGYTSGEVITDNWERLVFHLPYAFQARRMFSEIYTQEARLKGDLEELLIEVGMPEPQTADFATPQEYAKAYGKFLRAVTKTNRYRAFVNEKIERGERISSVMGNLYTSSIFLSLMSSIEADLLEGNDLTDSTIGFFAYGSGSKSKVFQGIVQPEWKTIVERFRLQQRLAERQAVDYSTYEQLHRGRLNQSVAPVAGEFYLAKVEADAGVREGARTYAWRERKLEQVEVGA